VAERLSLQFRRLLEERKPQRIQPNNDIIAKEIVSSEYDLGKSKNSFEGKDYKWAIIQAYYSIFHAARALIYSKGYREKSHRACLVALKEVFLDSLGEERIKDLEEAMDLRKSADYGSAYTDEDARNLVGKAEDFLENAKRILKT
jgi:uncharacterized protein (UPF0332 family)